MTTTAELVKRLRQAGVHLGNAIAGYRDMDFKRSAKGAVAAALAMSDAADAIERLEARVIAAEGERGWQPIETAPKDGTKVLLGRFAPGTARHGMVRVDWWRSTVRDDRYTGFGYFNPTYWPPTHWQPIPEPPAIAKERVDD